MILNASVAGGKFILSTYFVLILYVYEYCVCMMKSFLRRSLFVWWIEIFFGNVLSVIMCNARYKYTRIHTRRRTAGQHIASEQDKLTRRPNKIPWKVKLWMVHKRKLRCSGATNTNIFSVREENRNQCRQREREGGGKERKLTESNLLFSLSVYVDACEFNILGECVCVWTALYFTI